jgi:GNAT superfamily N-acetyltransferase
MEQVKFIIAHYKPQYRTSLQTCIDAVCAESPWMSTDRFEPNPAWERALLGDSNSAIFLAMPPNADKLIGWCRLFPVGLKSLELGIGVHVDYRRIGAGTNLMSAAFDWAKKRKKAEILLTTAYENRIAQDLFRKFGFVPGELGPSHLQMICYLESP